MNQSEVSTVAQHSSILAWAIERQVPITVSLQAQDRWCVLKSRFLRQDARNGVLQIVQPLGPGASHPEIVMGQTLGVSFRRGHKKCVFTTTAVMRQSERLGDGEVTDTLLVRFPTQLRELQRRAYQRVQCPPNRFIAVKMWEGVLGGNAEPSWPLCAGRVGNASMGGIQVDVRADQNPRLSIGDVVGLEITVSPGKAPLVVEAQYRHCSMIAPGRLGLGLQFIGLEHEQPGRSSIGEVAEFIKTLQRAAQRHERHQSHTEPVECK
jgi:hypothetical protein